MKKLVLIVFYFGKFPNYFQLWLDSCGKNEKIDWVIYTDNEEEYQFPKNVTIIKSNLEEIRDIFQKKFDFPIKLNTPYKLCDFKPAYGFILEKEIIKYKYWGHCDIDLIFGNLDKILEILETGLFDKILTKGHLTIYKNEYNNNRIFMQENKKYNYKDVFTNDLSFGFDESDVIKQLFDKNHKKIYVNEKIYIDIDYRYFNFYRIKEKKNLYLDKFIYDNGNVYRYSNDKGDIKKEKYIYIHFQKRKIEIENLNRNFYYIDNIISSKDKKIIKRSFKMKLIELIMKWIWRTKGLYFSRNYKVYLIKKKVRDWKQKLFI